MNHFISYHKRREEIYEQSHKVVSRFVFNFDLAVVFIFAVVSDPSVRSGWGEVGSIVSCNRFPPVPLHRKIADLAPLPSGPIASRDKDLPPPLDALHHGIYWQVGGWMGERHSCFEMKLTNYLNLLWFFSVISIAKQIVSNS